MLLREGKNSTSCTNEMTLIWVCCCESWESCIPYYQYLSIILGGTVGVIMEISSNLAVGISAAVAIIYTLMGGLYSVAYTDVIQLTFILLGLVQTLCFKEN